MPENSYQRFYARSEFVALVGTLRESIARIQAALNQVELDVPIASVQLVSTGTAIQINWADLPTAADVATIDALVPTIVGGPTTSAPMVFESYAVQTDVSGVMQAKIDAETPPLSRASYTCSWVSSIDVATLAANTGVEAKIRLERSDGAFVEQLDTWDLPFAHAFNGSQPFDVEEGQTIRAVLSFRRLGSSNTARMFGARVAINRLG